MREKISNGIDTVLASHPSTLRKPHTHRLTGTKKANSMSSGVDWSQVIASNADFIQECRSAKYAHECTVRAERPVKPVDVQAECDELMHYEYYKQLRKRQKLVEHRMTVSNCDYAGNVRELQQIRSELYSVFTSVQRKCFEERFMNDRYE